MFYVRYLTILNLIIVSKINLNGAVYRLFPALPCKHFDRKTKIQTLQWTVCNALILWNSKNKRFGVNKSYITATIMMEHAYIFGKLSLTRLLILPYDLTKMKQIPFLFTLTL